MTNLFLRAVKSFFFSHPVPSSTTKTERHISGLSVMFSTRRKASFYFCGKKNGKRLSMSIFPFPKQSCFLHIFEPNIYVAENLRNGISSFQTAFLFRKRLADLFSTPPKISLPLKNRRY